MVYFGLLALRAAIWIVQLYSYVLIASAILSWFMSPFHPVRRFLYRITEPVVAPIRALTQRWGWSGAGMGLDFSPMLAFLGIQLLLGALRYLQGMLFYL